MEEYNARILKAKQMIQNADYILIGAGAGLSTAAGLEYSGESFKKNFNEFIKKYNFSDLYSASFYPFKKQEEKWAFWAKLIKLNRFNSPLKLYKKLVPKCPVCGKNMEMNLRKDANFVQDENWYKQSKNYEDFLDRIKNENVVLLEIGVGFNTPGIIRFPFEQVVYNDLETTLIRINKDYPQTMLDIENKTISFDEDTKQIIEDLKEN